jgi:hypothetical protein
MTQSNQGSGSGRQQGSESTQQDKSRGTQQEQSGRQGQQGSERENNPTSPGQGHAAGRRHGVQEPLTPISVPPAPMACGDAP